MIRWFVLALILATLGDVPLATAAEARLPAYWRFVLPPGTASAGEQVFVRMECYSCHTVAGKRFGDPTQKPGGIGPDLTAAHARLPREYLAESIVNFDRYLAHGKFIARYMGQDGTSRMGDYNDLLTVRDLLDLVEFLKGIR
ncbi:MAG TPA: c-type cytochrome [Methylomirabilota bacterium]|nr:c-type cytochrome [Methylomirabilota bacterium]